MRPAGSAPRTLRMPGYLPRVADREIDGALRRRGAVLIEGCRAGGKTWAARNVARSEARLDDEVMLLLAAADPAAVLRGDTPRLLDEWQNAPQLWNRVRRECDDRVGFGHFILTGSAAPQDDTTRHTGVGRIGRVIDAADVTVRDGCLYRCGLVAEPVRGSPRVGSAARDRPEGCGVVPMCGGMAREPEAGRTRRPPGGR